MNSSIVIALVAFASSGGSAEPACDESGVFHQPRHFTTVYHPAIVAPADFDHDGVLDLAICNWDSIQSWRGRGDGRFTIVQRGELEASGAIMTGRIGADPHEDLFVFSQGSGTYALHAGRGDGTFQRQWVESTDLELTTVILADLDHDGSDDLVLHEEFVPSLHVRLSRPDGTFGAVIEVPTGSGSPPTVADMNGDGHPDLFQYEPGIGAFIAYGHGDGSFTRVSHVPNQTAWYPEHLVMVDINADDRVDLLGYDNLSGDDLRVMIGLGEGHFEEPLLIDEIPRLFRITTGDMNLDGHGDLVLVRDTEDNSESVLEIRLGDGSGAFAWASEYRIDRWPGSLVIADFNQDRMPDVLLGNTIEAAVHLIPGLGDGTLSVPTTQYRAGTGSGNPVIADFNGDGMLDVASTVSNFVHQLVYRLNEGDGALGREQVIEIDSWATRLESADLDGDGLQDLVLKRIDSVPEFVRGRGDGTFDDPVTVEALDGWPLRSRFVDVNQDGLPDVIELVGSENQLIVHESLGGLEFEIGPPVDLPCDAFHAWAIGDVNRDGAMDVIVSCDAQPMVSILYGQSDGTFVSTVVSVTPGVQDNVGTGDFDGDGEGDLLVYWSTGVGRELELMRGVGDGAFAPGQRIEFPPGTFPAASADIDRDGRDELLLVERKDSESPPRTTLYVAALDHDQIFHLETLFDFGAYGTLAAADDMDRNGAPDLVCFHIPTGQNEGLQDDFITVMLNQCGACRADLDGSTHVGFEDLLLMLSAWGRCTIWCAPDLTDDGEVGHADVAELLAHWGTCGG